MFGQNGCYGYSEKEFSLSSVVLRGAQLKLVLSEGKIDKSFK
jgi:hypothetical protein